MKRRDFLKRSAAATTPLLLNGVPLMASPTMGDSFFDMLAYSSQTCGKILVIIQQNGGNDGLNTVVPLEDNIYDRLKNEARGNVIVAKNKLLTLNATTGLNPGLLEMKNMYDAGKLKVVQGVSYPNPNFSHFRATDIWFSAADSNQYLDTGWLGRTLDTTYPYYPGGNTSPSYPAYPNTQAPDPLAIQIGSTLPFSLQGPGVNMGYNVSDPNNITQVATGTTDPAPGNDYGRELTFLRLMKDQSNEYKDQITDAYNAVQQAYSGYPANNSLANQLRMVARLIGGGLTTPIYIVNHPTSHDTHENQVDVSNADHNTGWQFNNLQTLSQAIDAFQKDLEIKGKASKVTGMTFSEFGRRVKSNDSNGTDHGTAAPVFFFGAGVLGGVLGNSLTLPPPTTPTTANPNPASTITSSTQINMQYDFRQLYATVMQDWLCLTPQESTTVLGSSFNTLPIFRNVVLPLAGVSLTGQYYSGQSRLTCKAEQNQQYTYYALEFSLDGARFSEVRRLTNTSLNAQEDYVYTHTTSAPKMFYRISAANRQGRVDYSNVITLRANDKQQLIRVYPNPVTAHNIHIEFLEPPTGMVEVTIYDLIGSKVYYNRFNGVQRSLNFRVPDSFSRETHYILEASYGDTKAREQIIFR